MPIYDYHCKFCGADTEVMQKISDQPAKKCPECGKAGLAKQVSASGFRLSGGGWYETDFKSGSKKNLTEKGGSSESAAGSSSASSSDSKADAKGDSGKKPDGRKPDGKKKEASA